MSEIRDLILSGRLRPGQRLLQEELASQFGSSRIPVREALRQLEGEGLVQLLPHKGARVVRLDLKELGEIYQIRERLEPLAISLSAALLSDAQLSELAESVVQMEEVTRVPSQENLTRFSQIDLQFHLASYSAANMPRLQRMIEELLRSSQPYRKAFIITVPRMDVQHREHRLILDALERRDSESAALVMAAHIRRTRLGLASHPEIFQSPLRGQRRPLTVDATSARVPSLRLAPRLERDFVRDMPVADETYANPKQGGTTKPPGG